MRILNRAPKNPYTRTTYGGKTVNWRTRAMLMVMGQRLYGDPYSLFVVQGSYNTGVSASAGTHDGGGAVDLTANDHARKVRVGRSVGFAIWHRPRLPGVWEEHVHGIAIGDQEAAPLAALQVKGYKQNRDGLGPWPFGSDNSWHPDPITSFNYQAWRKKYNARQADWFTMADKSDLKEVVDAATKRVLDRLNEVAGNDKERDQATAAALDTFRENAAKRDKALKDALDALTQVAQGTSTAAQVEQARQGILEAIAAG